MAQVPAIMYEAAGLSRYPRAIALMNLMYGIGNFCGGVMGGNINPYMYIANMILLKEIPTVRS